MSKKKTDPIVVEDEATVETTTTNETNETTDLQTVNLQIKEAELNGREAELKKFQAELKDWETRLTEWERQLELKESELSLKAEIPRVKETKPAEQKATTFEFDGVNYRFADHAPQLIRINGGIKTQQAIANNEELLLQLVAGGSGLVERI